MLIRHLSSNYPYDNVYSLFPFTIPTKVKEIVGSLSRDEQELYNQRKPHIGAAVSLEISSDIRAVFEDSTGAYSTPYGRDLKSLTKGTGYVPFELDGNLRANDLVASFWALRTSIGTLFATICSFPDTNAL